MRRMPSEESAVKDLQKRSREEMVYRILKVLAPKPLFKSHVEDAVHTNHSQMKNIYEPYLFENGLLMLNAEDKWEITKKGAQYLSHEEAKRTLVAAKGEVA